MTTHASAGKQWTEAELDSLTEENQFRLRGLEVTRLGHVYRRCFRIRDDLACHFF